MKDAPLPPVAAVVSFIDAINRNDLDRLADLMHDDHVLMVFDEPPLRGKRANVEAWKGYLSAYPRYVIAPDRIAELDDRVAVLGHTTGSHLGLPDDDEKQLQLIWQAQVVHGRLRSWQLRDDSTATHPTLGLDANP